MRNFVQPGQSLDYTNGTGSDIKSGDTVKMGAVIGVASGDIPDGETGAVVVEGVFELPKVTGTSWSMGDPLVWDESNGAFHKRSTVTKATGDVDGVAFAAADAAAADEVGNVSLNNPGTVT